MKSCCESTLYNVTFEVISTYSVHVHVHIPTKGSHCESLIQSETQNEEKWEAWKEDTRLPRENYRSIELHVKHKKNNNYMQGESYPRRRRLELQTSLALPQGEAPWFG